MTHKKEIIKSLGHYIDGVWLQGSGKRLESFNPATGALLWEGTHATANDITHAKDSAAKALYQWSTTSFDERVAYVTEFGNQIKAKQDELATLISLETGKPLWESRLEVTLVQNKINLSIQAYQERTWPKYTVSTESNSALRYKPQGVVAILGPFNFPAHLSNGHIIPALLAGNTLLYKPSEYTPAVAEMILTCWHASGLPKGVINCIQGDASSGHHLLSQDVQAVYFTGSYQTGLVINKLFCDRPEVLLALEMGGNNPLVLGEVDNVQAAVYHSLLSTLISSGQRCTCARRLIIPDDARGDAFLNRFIQACKTIKIGNFHEVPQPFMGPVISVTQAQKHLQAQEELLKMGGEPLLRMTSLIEHTGFLSPGILEMTKVVTPVDQEIFAPLVQVYRYQHFEEALSLANQTRFGLVAGLLSDKENQYRDFYQHIRAGLINWNTPTTGASSSLPFGGVGFSGNHRPSAYFAADYCAYPVASMEQPQLTTPNTLLPGIGVF